MTDQSIEVIDKGLILGIGPVQRCIVMLRDLWSYG